MKQIKLHLGCGKKYIPGFIHIDIEKYDHIDYNTDASDLHMFKDNSVDLIYSAHLLEHYKRRDIDTVLKEWYRVLKPDGTLRLAVPDFEALIKIYNKYKDLEMIMGPLYGNNGKLDSHYITFDFRYLCKRLRLIGFKNIQRYNWRETIHKNYDDYSQSYIPHLDKENGILISLNVEATK